MKNNSKHIFLMSKGQLFSTPSIDVVIEDLSSKTNINKHLIKSVIVLDMLKDNIPFVGNSIINDYKRGDICWDTFCNGIRKYLFQSTSGLSNESLKNSWNKMSELHDNSKAAYNISSIATLLMDNEDVIIIAPSATNKAHDKALKSTIDEFNNNSYDLWQPLEDIQFINSYQYGTIDYNELLKHAEISEDTKILSVTSFNKDINPMLIKGDLETEHKVILQQPEEMISALVEHAYETLST